MFFGHSGTQNFASKPTKNKKLNNFARDRFEKNSFFHLFTAPF